jgi:ubiquitin-conjugating enzyme E2 I
MSGALALGRLREERKAVRKDKPFGFWAKPGENEDGSQNMMKWQAGIPGKDGTCWAGGEYRLTMEFSEDYPTRPPKCQFHPVVFHPNIYPSGSVCLSILDAEKDWRPCIAIMELLVAIQHLLSNPNFDDPAQKEPAELFKKSPREYEKTVRADVKNHPKP